MGSLELFLKLAADGDLGKIAAASPALQADVNRIADDVIRVANDVKKLMADLTPVVTAIQKLNGA
jgi:hypothetical protein